MLTIIRRNAFWYFTHLATFGFPLWNWAFDRGRRGYLVFLTLMAPVWLSSSVLWSERNESYAFLRMLPVRDGDIVHAKLKLGLGAVVLYWAMLSFLTLLAWGPSPAFFARFSLINLICAASLPLVALCYLGVWRYGARAMTIPILVFMAITFFSVMGGGIARWRGSDFGQGLAPAPWPLQVFVPTAAFLVWLLLAKAAPRVKRDNEAHLQMP
jgi:hypothetical protein